MLTKFLVAYIYFNASQSHKQYVRKLLRENGDAASTGSLQLLFSARNDKNVKNPAATIVLQPVFLFILSFVYCCVRWVVSALLMNKVITILCSPYSFFNPNTYSYIFFINSYTAGKRQLDINGGMEIPYI